MRAAIGRLRTLVCWFAFGKMILLRGIFVAVGRTVP